jgi:hypothetical protein
LRFQRNWTIFETTAGRFIMDIYGEGVEEHRKSNGFYLRPSAATVKVSFFACVKREEHSA